jgi:hypothetical protein
MSDPLVVINLHPDDAILEPEFAQSITPLITHLSLPCSDGKAALGKRVASI